MTSLAHARPSLGRRCAAEAIGTFALVFAGCGAIVVDSSWGGLGNVGVSLVFGLVVGVMIYATGHLSGAHFNPAVTVAFAVTRRLSWPEAAAYVVAQTAAALGGAILVRVLLGDTGGLGATTPHVGLASAFVVEVVLTFFLMFVIAAVATDHRASAPLAGVAIGGTVALGALVGGPLTGASMNPARSLAPALVSGALAHLWLYLLAPTVGATLGALAYRFVAHSPAVGRARP